MNWNILVTRFKKSTESLLVVASESGLGLKNILFDVLKKQKKFYKTRWKSCKHNNLFFFCIERNMCNFAWILGTHPQSLNIYWWPIVNKYREGKVKRTPMRGVKQTWNWMLTSSWSNIKLWQRTFCIMGQRVNLLSKLKPLGVGEAKASLNRAFSSMD